MRAEQALIWPVNLLVQCLVWEMDQRAEMDITSLKMNHFYPNFYHKTV